jgi:hypothetical protein
MANKKTTSWEIFGYLIIGLVALCMGYSFYSYTCLLNFNKHCSMGDYLSNIIILIVGLIALYFLSVLISWIINEFSINKTRR